MISKPLSTAKDDRVLVKYAKQEEEWCGRGLSPCKVLSPDKEQVEAEWMYLDGSYYGALMQGKTLTKHDMVHLIDITL